MDELLLLLLAVGTLLAIGQFLDTYYYRSSLASRARSLLISAYVFVETKATFRKVWGVVGQILGVLIMALLLTLSFAVPTIYYILYFQAGWWSLLITFPENVAALFGILLVLFLIAALVYSIIKATIAVIQRVSMHLLSKASDPRVSPFGYTFAIIGVLVAVGTLAVEVARYVRGPAL